MWFLKRLSEPSSYAGISGIAAGAGALASGMDWRVGMAGILAGALAFIAPENKPPQN